MPTKPNVLLINTDHWSSPLLGAAGHPCILTPTLDTFCKNGVRFTNAYSEHPFCIPARRTLMTGASARAHGDRVFSPTMLMPDHLPTMAQTFRDAGYQAYAVGKIHVYPQRDRIGFDDVILDDEGRSIYNVADDYDIYLGDIGHTGRQFDHGMGNNQYTYRAWHLPEATHPTNWTTRMMARMIKRRDPRRPAFWYLSYRHPHPPLVPLQAYLDVYRDIPIDEPFVGEWARDRGELPYNAQATQSRGDLYGAGAIIDARRAFYALCTHIEHQIRIIIGTLREESLTNDTIICFTSDHGDMLGNHGMWAKRVFYEYSAGIPMILVGLPDDARVGNNRVDDRLVGLQDVMPTLLDLCGIEVPETVEGLSMVGDVKREFLFGEAGEDAHSSRMVHDGRHKLIYYPVGHYFQLFDLREDPHEMVDLFSDHAYADVLSRLTEVLEGQMYGSDEKWLEDGKLVGEPARRFTPGPDRTLSAMRGDQWPFPPATEEGFLEWFPEVKGEEEEEEG